MIPKSSRSAVLSHDAALDALVIQLYRIRDAGERAALRREMAAIRESARKILADHVVAAGDLRH
jgi:hypothetical protein